MDYEYIKRTYGAEFYPGDRVDHIEGRPVRAGTVLPVKSDALHYVHVDFDGSPGLCHPSALKIVARGGAWAEAKHKEGDR